MRTAISIHPESATPLHRQICEAWRAGILSGRFARGEGVPSTRELAKALGVSRSTVTLAYEQLVAEGYLESAQGSGTFVCQELPDELLRAASRTTAPAGPPATIRLSRMAARLRHDFSRPSARQNFIDLSRWGPDLQQFPFQIWRKLLGRHLRSGPAAQFDYASDCAGQAPLREAIAAYLTHCRAVQCTAEQVIILSGSQQALDLCTRLLLDPGDEVAMEDPGYLGARWTLQAYGAKLKAVALDAEGIKVSELGSKARLVYVTPSHQFPTGVAMSLARRLALLQWARRNRSVIVEDDYDSEYRYRGPPLPSLQGLANGAAVIYCGTFSKVMFPGLRLGYAVLPASLLPAFSRAKWLADRNCPPLEQSALTDFLTEGHLERHIRRMRRLYAQRREVLVDSLQRCFGGQVVINGEPAGMHLPVQFTDPTMQHRAQRNGVQLSSMAPYWLAQHAHASKDFLLGFSCIDARTILEGVRRLSR